MMRFIRIAVGSANELEYQLLLARDLGFSQTGIYDQLDAALTEVKRMLRGLLRGLKSKQSNPSDSLDSRL
jgi:four helix bundle protein